MPARKQVLAEIKEPINLYFYFSRDAAAKQSPLIMPYAARVREFLEEIAARSGGKIHLRVIDPQPFSDDEDRAAEAGLQSLQAGAAGDALYFGLAGTNSTDGRSVIPNFQPDREEFLEYDVAKLIQELATPKKPVIGLMSSLPMQGQFNPMTGQMGEPWPILSADRAAVHGAHADRAISITVDKDVDVLMLVHPKQLPPKTLYAIDQFVMRGGKILLFVDPDSGADIERPGSFESVRRRDGESLLDPASRCSRRGASTTIRERSSATSTSGSKCAPACRRRRRAISAFSACGARR